MMNNLTPYEQQVIETRDSFQSEWLRVLDAEKKLSLDKEELALKWQQLEKQHKKLTAVRNDFEQEIAAKFDFVSRHTIITLNIGGQIITSTAEVLSRDRFSILALLCTKCPIIEKDENGHFFFDRDWWIFQYILQFLQDKVLPDSPDLLRELYYEASFYRMGLLRHAIERKILLQCTDLDLSSLEIFHTTNNDDKEEGSPGKPSSPSRKTNGASD